MARDPAAILLAIRRHTVEQARLALAACLNSEAVLSDRIKTLDAAVRQDSATAASWQDAYRFMETSAFRLGAVRAERTTIAADLAAAASRTAEARDVVTTARTAAETVEQLIAERLVTSRAESERRAQHVVDDIARARFTKQRQVETIEPLAAQIVRSTNHLPGDRE